MTFVNNKYDYLKVAKFMFARNIRKGWSSHE